jgi:hypothetical protein
VRRHAKASSAGSTEGSSRGLFRRAFATRGVSSDAKGSGARSSRALSAAIGCAAAAMGMLTGAAPASAAPIGAKMETISNVSYASAHVTGKISSPCSGFCGTSYSFQYATSESGPWNPGPGKFFPGTPLDNEPVKGDIEGLKGGTQYFVRLAASTFTSGPLEAIDPATQPYPSFTTLTVDPPSVVSTDNAPEVSYTTATVKGKVSRPANADAAFDVDCHFQYVTDEQFQATGFTENPGDVPCEGTNPIKAPGTSEVEAHLEGLANNTTYHLRLTANNAGGEDAKEAASTFTTLTVGPPSVISTDNAAEVEYTQAQVKGVVERPNTSPDPAFDVTCNFEYITDAQFEENLNVNSQPGFTGATPVLCTPNPVTAADTAPGSTKAVTASLTGLSASTTYHLRLSASNLGGSDAKEAAANFTTEGPVPAPSVLSIADAGDISYKAVTAKGQVERPAGADPALNVNCRFEYITDEQFTANPPGEGFSGAGQAVCEPEGNPTENPITAAGPTSVTAQLANLSSGVTYHLRLVAENGGGTVTKTADNTFTTTPGGDPSYTIQPPIMGYTTAQVSGILTPGAEFENIQLESFFEYAEVGTENWSGPGGDGGFEQVPVGLGPHGMSHEIHHLTPDTEYKFRITIQIVGNFYPPFGPVVTGTTRALEHPTATLDPVTAITGTGAHFSGTVATNAPAGALDALGKTAYKTEWEFLCTPECSGGEFSGTVQGEEGSKAISFNTSHLTANTFYEVKLVAHNEVYSVETPAETFQTPLVPAGVKAEAGASDGEGGYFLQGVINSNNSKVTSCVIEYGTTATYPNTYQAPCLPNPSGSNEVQNIGIDASEGQFKLSFRGQTTSDLPFNASTAEVQAALRALSQVGATGVNVTGPPGAYVVTFAGKLAGADVEPIKASDGTTPLGGGGGASVSTATEGGLNHPVTIEAHVENLTIDAHYHFRIFTTNAAGPSSSADREFVPTLAPPRPGCENEQLRHENSSDALPECRALEQVTPAFKQGYGASLVDFSDGDAVAYSSLAGNIANSGLSLVAVFPVNIYTTVRTTAGWQTRANLNGPSGSVYSSPENAFGFSSGPVSLSKDLLSSVYGMQKPPVPGFQAYLRRPDGTFVLMGKPVEGNAASNLQEGVYVGASDDFDRQVFNGFVGGTIDTPLWGPGVYEFVGIGNDQPDRVDLDNSGSPITTCGGAISALGKSVSRDGRVIVFSVVGGCGGANPPANELWARVDGTTSFDLSASQCSPACASPETPATFQGAAADGSRVFFTTTQQLVNGDTDEANDLYACDIPSGTPAPVGTANSCASLREISGAATGANVQNVIATSEDGSTVYFKAKGVLADNEDALGEDAVAGDNNLYVWRQNAAHPAGQTTFIAPNVGGRAQVTPDGRYLALDTATPLLATDTDNAIDIYRYDADTGEMIRASTGPTGTGGNADGFDANFASFGNLGLRNNTHYVISDNGQKMVFSTAEALSPLDGNGGPDIYLWTPGRVSNISLSSGEQGVIDPSGEDIYFQSAAALTPGDGDQSLDVYDARVNGGFSFAETTCSGEGCRPPASPSSAPKSLASQGAGPGNPTPPKGCPKGKIKKHGKCVRKAKKHSGKKSHGKKAGHNRGGGK